MVEKISDQELENLLYKLEKERGLDLDCTQFRPSYIKRRILTRLRANKVGSCLEYCLLLDKKPEEYQKLLDALTVNVSGFFRDKEVYQVFEVALLPQLLEAKRRRNQQVVRIWSAGCATGEEPYSIAMIVWERKKNYSGDFLISTYATDVDNRCLKVAKSAKYPKERLSEIPRRYWQSAISRRNGAFSIKPEVRSLVKFMKGDLFAGNDFRYIDVIFCRNVLIYFTRSQQVKLYKAFRKALNQGGLLIIGRTEKLVGEGGKLFKTIDSRKSIYQKRSNTG